MNKKRPKSDLFRPILKKQVASGTGGTGTCSYRYFLLILYRSKLCHFLSVACAGFICLGVGAAWAGHLEPDQLFSLAIFRSGEEGQDLGRR